MSNAINTQNETVNDWGIIYKPKKSVQVIKKDGSNEEFNVQKVIIAIEKSAYRALTKFTNEEKQRMCKIVIDKVDELGYTEIPISIMHNIVESALEDIKPIVAKSYRDYRNYKQDFVHMLDEVYKKSQSIMYIGDKENSNTDSALVSTKRSLIFNQLNKELYQKFFMTTEEIQACREGYIYAHDMSARRDTMNCFARSTRFITDRGVKSFYDFNEGDTVNVISQKGRWRKATVHSYGYQQLQTVTFKRAAGKEKEVLVTPNHRWFLEDGSETTELKVGDKLTYTPNITAFNFEDLSREDQKLWCLGFAFGDGSVVSDDNIPIMHVRLCGNKIQFASRFESVGYKVTYPKSLNGDGMVRMTDVHTKEVPYLQLNKDNVLFFVNGYLEADGNRNPEGHNSEFRGVQITGEFNDIVYDLLNMSGYYVTNTTDLTGQETNYGTRVKNTIQYQIYSDCDDRTWFVSEIKPAYINRRAEVWCLDVEDDHGFVLEAGIPTGNCCLFDMENVLKGGFEMGNIWYNEPKTLDTAFDVIGDVTLSAASQQYGGFTIPEVDRILEPYAEKSYKKYLEKYARMKVDPEIAEAEALSDVKRDFEQGFQGWEYKFNTVGSSRGDYPFITITGGLGRSRFAKMASIAMLDVRRKGQGKKEHKKPVLFPKIVFLYDKNLHGPGKELEDVFDAGIACSMKTMYPDWLSLTGEGYVPSIYKKYGKVISCMGCRAFLSPWYERGGMYPADDNDEPVFIGRFNIGAVSLHLPMILAKARQESRDFYEVLDYYLNLIRQLHIRTYAYLSEMRASTNPLAYCEGGFLGGHLGLHDKIKPLLKAATASFGITALNELQMLYNGKSLVEDGEFALEVMEYINKEVNRFKEEDGNLYAIYGTPAENLCFDADTMVQCYGGNKRIADIKVGDLVYSFNEKKHKVELKPVTMSKMTRRNAEVVKITFDNEQQIICTPDHPIGVRVTDRDEKGQFTGERLKYVKAKDLVKGMRIKSNYMYINAQGRWECSIYHNKKHQLVQDINAEYAYGEKPDGHVTHHKDEVKTNNEFSNLEYMADKAHRIHHLPLTIESHQYTREDVLGEKNPFYGKHHTDEAKQKNRNAHIGKSICALSENGSIVKEFDCADDAEKAGFTRHAVVMACRGKSYFNDHKYKKMHWYYKNECPAIAEANHKVESVEYLTETRDVYDITVEDNHNFFVGDNDGILVHNCGLQVKQFRAKYGIVEGVSDREYVSNSFHCHVSENITPIEKQDLEYRFWNFFNGGKIQYVKYPIDYNVQAVKTLVRRAMNMGFYEGVNMSLAYCDDCGHQELEMDICPKCGSHNLTKIDRMNGYLSYSRVHGDTRLNAAKMAEIAERKSM